MPASPPRTAVSFPRRFACGIVLVAFVFNLWALTRYWNENMRDGHEFRQYQTALTALFFQKGGLKLAYETPVLGPPWSVPMEFPLYQAIVAKLSTATRLPLEQAGRLTSLLAFLGCFPAVRRLLRKRLPEPGDWLLVAAAALLCPLFLFYSRTVLIESTALCVSLWFLAAFDAALEQPAAVRILGAWVLGAFAAATKITTFAVVAFPAIAITAALAWQRRRAGLTWARATARPLLLAALLASVPVAVGLAWVIYSDHLKALNPYGEILTSDSLRTFNFGTLPQRLSLPFWQTVGYNSFRHVISIPLAVLTLGGLLLVSAPYRRLALVCLACYCGGFLLFANLYFVHDYYYYASAFLLVAAAGVVAAGLLHTTRLPRRAAMLLITLALGGNLWAFHESYYGFYRRPNPPAPGLATAIRAAIGPEDVFAAFDLDWNSMLAYHAQRRAIMVFKSHTEDDERFEKSLAHLEPKKVAAIVIAEPHRGSHTFLFTHLNRLDMAAEPIASTEQEDLYVRSDLLAAAADQLRGKDIPGVRLHLPPDVPTAPITGEHDLTGGDWPSRLSMARPAPVRTRGEYPIGIVTLDGAPVISCQAPTEIVVRPPSSARHVEIRCGMFPSSYLNGNETDGVDLEIREELPDGSHHILFRHSLRPFGNRKDRSDVVFEHTYEEPLRGTLVFSAYPGPNHNDAYDWVYWRSIEVR
jgi:hypothetical protein